MDELTPCVSLIFGLIAFLTVFTFYKAAGAGTTIGIALLFWVTFHSVLSASGFYKTTDTITLKLSLVTLLPLLLLVWLFSARPGKAFLDRMDMHLLTVIHVVRAPMEVILYWLFVYGIVPAEMTIEGGNLNILAGLTAPLIYYFGVLHGKIKWQLMVSWNLISLGLLVNVVLKSTLMTPFLFQSFAFEQPAVSAFYPPFVLLPAAIAPVIICAHLAAIRSLIKTNFDQVKAPIDERLILNNS